MTRTSITTRAIAFVVLSFFAVACAQTGGTKQTVGGLAGAGLGGLAGAQFGKGSGRLWTTGAGVLLGALAGSSIGQSLDQADQMYAERAYTQAQTAPVGKTITWNNPDSGNSGAVTTTRTGTAANGLPCREYQQSVNIGGQTKQVVGTACQNGDGTWYVVQ